MGGRESDYSVCPRSFSFFSFFSLDQSGYISFRWRDRTWSSTTGRKIENKAIRSRFMKIDYDIRIASLSTEDDFNGSLFVCEQDLEMDKCVDINLN